MIKIFFSFIVTAFIIAYPIAANEQKTNIVNSQATELGIWLEKSKNNFSKKILDNGLTVVCYQIPNSYNVHMSVTYEVGSKDEKKGEYGLAHMVEHMIFKGTDKLSETDIQEIGEKFCAGWNAFTQQDITSYYFTTDKNNWPIFMGILADCMFNARMDENHFNSEVKAVINELNMRNQSPRPCMYDLSGSILYPVGHPYHHSIGGYKEDLLQATSHDLKRFYNKHYHPDKALLLVVGDINPDEIFKEAEILCNQKPNNILQKETVLPNIPPRATQHFNQTDITLYKPIPNPIISYNWKTVGKTDKTIKSLPCISYVLNRRLTKLLVDDLNLVFYVAAQNYTGLLGGALSISFEPKHEKNNHQKLLKTIQRVKQEILSVLKKFSITGVTPEELMQFKQLVKTGFADGFENAHEIANSIAYDFFPLRDETNCFKQYQDILALDNESIKRFLSTYIRPHLTHTMSIFPIPEEEKNYWGALQKDLEMHEQNLLSLKPDREGTIEKTSLIHDLPEPIALDLTVETPDLIVTLSNGLDVYVKRTETTPLTHLQLGRKDAVLRFLDFEQQKKDTIASFAQCLLGEESDFYTKQQHLDFFAQYGAHCIFGSSLSCLPEALQPCAERFVHILTTPHYNQKFITREIRDRIKNITFAQEDASYLASSYLRKNLYKDYKWVTFDDEEYIRQLQAITRQDIIKFHHDYINPENFFLVIAGNINLKTIQHDLEKTFGQWHQHPDAKKINTSSVIVPEIDNHAYPEKKISLPKEQFLLQAGRLTTYFDTDDRMALRLFEAYFNKKLFEIREQTGLFYSCNARLSSANKFTKGMAIISTITSGENLEATKQHIIDMMKTICEKGMTQEDLITAQRNYRMALAKSLHTTQEKSDFFISTIAQNNSFDYYATCIQQAEKMTLTDINRLIQKYLDPATWTWVSVGRFE